MVPLNDVLSLANSLAFIHTFLSLAWTAIFFVKFSFLALFRVLLKHISRKLSIYFWVMVGYFVVTWMFLVTEAFIVCPYYGAESSKCPLNTVFYISTCSAANGVPVKCTPETPRTKTLALTIFITILDVTSDIMSTTSLGKPLVLANFFFSCQHSSPYAPPDSDETIAKAESERFSVSVHRYGSRGSHTHIRISNSRQVRHYVGNLLDVDRSLHCRDHGIHCGITSSSDPGYRQEVQRETKGPFLFNA